MTKTHLIVGGTIGQALAEAFAFDHPQDNVHLTYHSRKPDIDLPNISCHQLNATDDESVARLCSSFKQLDSVIVCSGFLHNETLQPEKTIRRTSAQHLQQNMTLNVMPTMLLAKNVFSLLKKSEAPIFATVSAKVGSIDDNRLGGWYSYRASKAALNMIVKSLSIEWQRAIPKAAVAALHPGTVDSQLSAPFSTNAKTIFTPEQSARYLKQVIDKLSPETTGRFWSWDGSELPW